jgi:hypothetical protein
MRDIMNLLGGSSEKRDVHPPCVHRPYKEKEEPGRRSNARNTITGKKARQLLSCVDRVVMRTG